jgi:quaternary ammonium compound-resistance protein SugE
MKTAHLYPSQPAIKSLSSNCQHHLFLTTYFHKRKVKLHYYLWKTSKQSLILTAINSSTSYQEKRMAWTYLVIAGILECGWAIGLKYTEGFTKLVPSIAVIATMVVSIWLLSVSMKSIPVGTAYAVWTGIGATGVATIGMLFLGESREVIRILCLLLIVAGIVGLKLVAPETDAG